MKKKILIVDDDASIRDSLKTVLQQQDYAVVLAASADEAETLLQDASIDLLIADLFMPNRDGWDVLDVTSAQYPALPIIVMTGLFDQLATYQLAGVDALFAKPVEPSAILKVIEDLLARPSLERPQRSKPAWKPWYPHIIQSAKKVCA